MVGTRTIALVMLGLMLAHAVNYGNSEADWDTTCKNGTRQSPVDIKDATDEDTDGDEFSMQCNFNTNLSITNDWVSTTNVHKFYPATSATSNNFGTCSAY
jgi:carbonic anhydrase